MAMTEEELVELLKQEGWIVTEYGMTYETVEIGCDEAGCLGCRGRHWKYEGRQTLHLVAHKP